MITKDRIEKELESDILFLQEDEPGLSYDEYLLMAREELLSRIEGTIVSVAAKMQMEHDYQVDKQMGY